MTETPEDECTPPNLGWTERLCQVFDTVGKRGGGTEQTPEVELRGAIERLRMAIGAEGLTLVELGPKGGKTVAAAGHATYRTTSEHARLLETARDSDRPVVGKNSLAVVAGRDPTLVMVAHGAAFILDEGHKERETLLRVIASWLAAECRRSARMRLWADEIRDDKYQSLSQLALRSGHDFRTALAAILSHTEFVLDRFGEHHLAHRDLEDAVLTAREATARVDALMAFGGLLDHPVLQPIGLTRHVGGIMPVLRALVPQHISLESSVEPELRAAIPPVHLRQVLVNLVTNAAQAIGNGSGQIGVQARAMDRQGHTALITVEDDGPGMDHSVIRRATDPFFSTRQGRQGMGLAVAMGIARGVGGDLRIDSDLGKGTVIRVIVPQRCRIGPARIV